MYLCLLIVKYKHFTFKVITDKENLPLPHCYFISMCQLFFLFLSFFVVTFFHVLLIFPSALEFYLVKDQYRKAVNLFFMHLYLCENYELNPLNSLYTCFLIFSLFQIKLSDPLTIYIQKLQGSAIGSNSVFLTLIAFPVENQLHFNKLELLLSQFSRLKFILTSPSPLLSYKITK